VKDELTKEPIPFVKVYPSSSDPFLTDLDGAFQLSPGIKSVELHYNGYPDTTVLVDSIINQVIYFQEALQQIEEIVVQAGENRAHRIIREVIKNRKSNHPLAEDAFRYQSYSKFTFDINQDYLASISDTTSDTTIRELRKFFTDQSLFLIESASERTFIPPYRDKEEVKAYKVSGFNDPMFSSFVNSMQSFSFYDTKFDILGKQYLNPIAFGGVKRYLFILEDTTIVNQDTTFTIFYRPRVKKDFNGLTGRLYINTNGFAIEKVTASPFSDTSGMVMNIVQEYEFIENKKWFPVKLSTKVEMKSLLVKNDNPNSYMEGKGTAYIEDIELNPSDLKKRYNDNIKFSTDPNAAELDKKEWDSLRRYELTQKELRTYEMIDSLSEAQNFDKKLRALKILMEGKIPIGKYNIIIPRLFDYNEYEGMRFGLGLETSDKLMKPVTIGGYFAWGTKDKVWKYGGYADVNLYRRRGLKLDIKFQQDVIERGGIPETSNNLNMLDPSLARGLFISNMENQRLAEIGFSGDIKSNLTLRLFGNYQRNWFTEDYKFTFHDNMFTQLEELDAAEVGVDIQWNPFEKYMLLGYRKVSLGTKAPKIQFRAVKGMRDVFESELEYYRFNFNITHDLRLNRAGRIQWKLAAASVIGDVPLYLYHVGDGTGLNWNISVVNSFETMVPSTFYSRDQVSLFTRYTFPSIKTKAKWNEPTFSLHHGIGYGSRSEIDESLLPYGSMERGYMEGGLILDKILVSGFSVYFL
jgi:hypothetical protein